MESPRVGAGREGLGPGTRRFGGGAPGSSGAPDGSRWKSAQTSIEHCRALQLLAAHSKTRWVDPPQSLQV
jgi:hypothetical protein